MKTLRNHLFVMGVVAALMADIGLAQAPATPAAPAAPPGVRRTLPASPIRRPIGAPPAAAAPAAASGESSGVVEPPLSDQEMEDFKRTGKARLKLKNDADVEMVLKAYEQAVSKTMLVSPGVQAQLKTKVTLTSPESISLSREEYLDALEMMLSMNGVVLEPFGEKFIKVLAFKTVRTDGIPTRMDAPEGGYPEKGQIVSLMIQLKFIAVAEAQKAIEGFKRPDGLIQTFERTNSLLVTDTQENVNRILEIIKFMDQPLVATEEVHVRTINHAKADDIKKRLEEIVAESQKQTQAKDEVKPSSSGAPTMVRTAGTATSPTGRPLPPGLARLTAQQAAQPASTPNETLETLVSDADRGMIRGKVQIIADERSNQLIIITRTENMNFFERIINVLDIETAPDVKVDVQRLEFADAEEVSTMLNDLIGNATAKRDDAAPAGAAARGSADTTGRSTSLEAAAARANRTGAATSPTSEGKSKLGQLSKDNIKILADKRTNAIVMMGSPSDLLAIKEIIKGMDIQLAQVLIETVVISVELSDGLRTGMDWVKRVTQSGDDTRYTIGGGGGSGKAQDLFGDLVGDVVSNAVKGVDLLGSVVTSGGSGLEYLTTFKGLKLDAMITASKTDGRSKVLTSPVLLTVDNKEATIEATTMRYLYKGVRYSGGGYNTGGMNNNYNSGYEVPDFEQRDIGLTVKVTPRINPNGTVVLTIDETFETVGPDQDVNGQKYPTINTRKLQADISMENSQTVILGGLVQNEVRHSEGGIPILKDIPFIGKYLFGNTSDEETRTELLVFMTPYVINSPEDMDREARRRKDYINAPELWTKGWSDSKLADPVSEKEMKRRLKQKEDIEKAWQNYRKSLEEHQELDDRIIEERIRTEAVIDSASAASFEKEAVLLASVTNGTLQVSESLEMLLAPDGTEGGGNTAAATPKKKKSWWKLW